MPGSLAVAHDLLTDAAGVTPEATAPARRLKPLAWLRRLHREGAQAAFGSTSTRDPGARSVCSAIAEARADGRYRGWVVLGALPFMAAGIWARRIGWARARMAGRRRGTEIRLGYPTSVRNEPRYGYDRAPHPRLESLLGAHASTYETTLAAIATYTPDLARIPRSGAGPRWDNQWFSGLDAASLYAFIRARRPQRYVEIGAGDSTWFAARARDDGSPGTEIVSIDPSPRRDVAGACDVPIRRPLEATDLARFQELEPDDVVFVDCSHRVFMNSDVVTFYLDVLPRLPSGVLVDVHDIYWPDDYPPHLAPAYLSEQYLLAAYLLAEASWIRPRLACHYVSTRPELREAVAAVEAGLPAPQATGARPSAFWFVVDHSSAPTTLVAAAADVHRLTSRGRPPVR